MLLFAHYLFNRINLTLQLIAKTLELKIPCRVRPTGGVFGRRSDSFEILKKCIRNDGMRDAGFLQQLDILLDRIFGNLAILASNYIGKGQVVVRWSQIIRHRTIISNDFIPYKFEPNGDNDEASV